MAKFVTLKEKLQFDIVEVGDLIVESGETEKDIWIAAQVEPGVMKLVSLAGGNRMMDSGKFTHRDSLDHVLAINFSSSDKSKFRLIKSTNFTLTVEEID